MSPLGDGRLTVVAVSPLTASVAAPVFAFAGRQLICTPRMSDRAWTLARESVCAFAVPAHVPHVA
jgi:hypothetical protein